MESYSCGIYLGMIQQCRSRRAYRKKKTTAALSLAKPGNSNLARLDDYLDYAAPPKP